MYSFSSRVDDGGYAWIPFTKKIEIEHLLDRQSFEVVEYCGCFCGEIEMTAHNSASAAFSTILVMGVSGPRTAMGI